nr:immunoglobulin light chain junction region [Macaca mulatta]
DYYCQVWDSNSGVLF